MTNEELIEKLKGITGTTEDGELINMVLYDRMITADNLLSWERGMNNASTGNL